MQTSLKAIANKARRVKSHRFSNLSRLLNEDYLCWCFQHLNRKASVGVDQVSYQDYETNLKANVKNLVERLKGGSYHAKLVRRKNIPKANGKMRPLGIPALEDKLLQYAVSKILEAIYEQDFLDTSYGYRPGKSVHDAVKDVKTSLTERPYAYVVEADIEGFFNNINHDWLVKMLEQRINDRSFIRIIKKWLRAGILEEDGKVTHPVAGTPQGGIISPILANIYMHYVLNLWFERKVRPCLRRNGYLCVYADDFICAFECRNDAERFYEVLSKRLAKFHLSLSKEKTNLINFDRKSQKSIDFLGFEFRVGRSRKRLIRRRTSKKKLQASYRTFKEWCKNNRNLRLNIFFKKLNRKLRGYYNFYGLRGNKESLVKFNYLITKALYKWLNRRSQRKSYTPEGFDALLKDMHMLKPRIMKPY